MKNILLLLILFIISSVVSAQDVDETLEKEKYVIKTSNIDFQVSVIKKMKTDICFQFSFDDTIAHHGAIDHRVFYADTAILIDKIVLDSIMQNPMEHGSFLELENGELYYIIENRPFSKSKYDFEKGKIGRHYEIDQVWPPKYVSLQVHNNFRQEFIECLPFTFPKANYTGKFRLIIEYTTFEEREKWLIYSNWTEW